MKKWSDYSLRTQLILVFAIIQIILFTSIFYFLTLNYREFYLQQLKTALVNDIELIRNDNNIMDNINNPEKLDAYIKEVGSNIETRITLVNKEGKVLADSSYKPELMDNHASRPEISTVMNNSSLIGVSSRKSSTLEQEMFYVAAFFNTNNQNIVIRMSKSLENINSIIRNNIYRYLVFLLILLFLSNMIVWYFSKSVIKPLNKIKKMAQEIVEGKRTTIEDVNYSNSELGNLVNEYNRLGIELDKKIERITEEKNKLSAILNSMTEGVIATDQNKKILMMNPKACKLLNIKCENIEGKNFISEIRDHRLNDYLDKVLEENKHLNTELTFKTPEKTYLECSFQTIADNNGSIVGAVMVLIDVTRLKKLEEMRKDFVANVSHELKTPLTSIKGYADTIIENKISEFETIEKFVGIISKEATRLNLLINDLLDLSKLEANYFELKPENIDYIYEKPLRILKSKAEQKNIDIINHFDDDLPLVMINKPQIENLLINLIDNAIKYNKEDGKIYLRAYQKEDKVFIEIEDTGLGIPEQDQERIFERFYRVDKARSKEIGGTGIGLSIVKHIVKGHNSEIEVKSVVEQGTCFRFYLTIAK
ncbi:MAG: ATP-binding protein [Halanaerobiales bacterium]|nr:ATP-binding protein [Halanaerobiales bacterium]